MENQGIDLIAIIVSNNDLHYSEAFVENLWEIYTEDGRKRSPYKFHKFPLEQMDALISMIETKMEMFQCNIWETNVRSHNRFDLHKYVLS